MVKVKETAGRCYFFFPFGAQTNTRWSRMVVEGVGVGGEVVSYLSSRCSVVGQRLATSNDVAKMSSLSDS